MTVPVKVQRSSIWLSSADGEDGTLQEQLIKKKAQISEARTATQTAQMKLSHNRTALKQKKDEMKRTAAAYSKDQALLGGCEGMLAAPKITICNPYSNIGIHDSR